MKNRTRCSWVRDDPIAIRYHDEEYGRPISDDDELFERLALEIFQAGLNWRLILHKQEAFRRAFSGFSIERVANFTEKDVERLMNDDGIIRNRMKIEATIENARRLKKLIRAYGSFANFVGGLDGKPEDLFKEFKREFRFMGPKIAESFLQSIGKLAPVHEPRCWKAKGRGRSRR